jgi:hypothetical protein
MMFPLSVHFSDTGKGRGGHDIHQFEGYPRYGTILSKTDVRKGSAGQYVGFRVIKDAEDLTDDHHLITYRSGEY